MQLQTQINYTLNDECLIQCLVYKATSTISNNSFVYYRTFKVKFKTRYSNYTKSFRHHERVNQTELSKHLWNLKNHGFNNSLLWETHKKALPHQCFPKRSNLCLLEKVSIICVNQDTLLNKINFC